ncbi:MAG: hypothetical protein K0T99_03820 [Alphaproteobacteria bacterium]|nr:hypothetical protein [Alphaproteobacteria bacterium]
MPVLSYIPKFPYSFRIQTWFVQDRIGNKHLSGLFKFFPEVLCNKYSTTALRVGSLAVTKLVADSLVDLSLHLYSSDPSYYKAKETDDEGCAIPSYSRDFSLSEYVLSPFAMFLIAPFNLLRLGEMTPKGQFYTAFTMPFIHRLSSFAIYYYMTTLI